MIIARMGNLGLEVIIVGTEFAEVVDPREPHNSSKTGSRELGSQSILGTKLNRSSADARICASTIIDTRSWRTLHG